MKPAVRNAALAAGSLGLIVIMTACGQSAGTGPAPVSGPGMSTPNPDAPETNPAGDIPDNQVYVPFSPADHRFTVSVPEGWSRSTDGTATVFTDKFNSIRIDTVPRAQAPTDASAATDELPTVRSATPGYVAGSVTTVQRSAGPAVLITYQAASAPDPVTGKTVTEAVERYEFWRSGQELILTLSGPQGADNVDPWRTVTDSVRWPG